MIQIKDELFLGFVAGTAANLVINLFDYTLYLMGISTYMRWHIAASLFFPASLVKTLPATIIGIFADYTVAILIGVLLTYLLRNTGFDYGLVKGLSAGLVAWVIGIGLLVSNVDHLIKPPTNVQLVLLIDHILFGILLAWFIRKFKADVLE